MSSILLAARKQEVIAKVRSCIEEGNRLFGIVMPHIDIRFDLKGRAAGMACQRGHQHYVRFNYDMLARDAFDHIINNTVPHEVAHSFCHYSPSLGDNHNSGWERICIALGGTGATRHSEDVVYGKGMTLEYTSSKGHPIRISETMHKRIQTGTKYNLRHDKGTVCKLCNYSIVGVRGVTLAEPIVKGSANHPVATTHVVRQSTYHIGAPEVPKVTKPAIKTGVSKASIAQAIMLLAHKEGAPYEHTIAAIMSATGHTRQLARSYFKHYAPKLGIPVM